MSVITIVYLVLLLMEGGVIYGSIATLTPGVLTWLSRTFYRNQLPKYLGGGKGQDFPLAQGEDLQFVLVQSPIQMWFMRQPLVNPRRMDAEGNRAKGDPPLVAWIIILPLAFTVAACLCWYLHMCFVLKEAKSFPLDLLPLVACFSLLCFPLVYWVYEWNRLHFRLVVTLSTIYIVPVHIPWEIHLSPTPVSEAREPIGDSTWSESPSWLARMVGGLLYEKLGISNAFISSRAIGAADLLVAFPWAYQVLKILIILRRQYLDTDADMAAFGKVSRETRLRAIAMGAGGKPMTIAGGPSESAQALVQAEKLEQVFAKRFAEGRWINFLDSALLGQDGKGWTRWNFQDLSEIENPPPPPYLP